MPNFWEDRVLELRGQQEGSKLVQAFGPIQRRLHDQGCLLRPASIYHYYLGALQESEALTALQERSGLEVLTDIYDHLQGGVLLEVMVAQRFRSCLKFGFLPIAREADDSGIIVGVLDKEHLVQIRELVEKWYGAPVSQIKVIPHLCFINFWEGVKWCLRLGGYLGRIPDPKGPHALVPDLIVPPGKAVASHAAAYLARRIALEALCLGSSRLARRILRVLASLCNWRPVDAHRLKPFSRFIDDLIWILFNAIQDACPLVPALLPWAMWARSLWKRDEPFDAARLSELHVIACESINLLLGDMKASGTALGALLDESPEVVVCGAPSMIVRAALLRRIANKTVRRCVFVHQHPSQPRSSFALTSFEFMRNAAAFAGDQVVTIQTVGDFVRDRPMDLVNTTVFLGAAHVRGDSLVCESGSSFVAGLTYPARLVAVIGLSSKTIRNERPAFTMARARLEGLASEIRGYYWREILARYVLVPREAISVVV